MPTFRTKDGRVVSFKPKGGEKRKKAGPPPAKGTCKIVRMKNGCTQKLCYDGKGVTGWTFRAGTRSCPNRGR